MDPPAMIDYLGELLGGGPAIDSMIGEFNRRRGRMQLPGYVCVKCGKKRKEGRKIDSS